MLLGVYVCKCFFFDYMYIILESVFLFLHIGKPSVAISKMSLLRSVVVKLHDSNCNVLCGSISDVWCIVSVTVCAIDFVIVY